MSNLGNSKYAPKTPAEVLQQSKEEKLKQDKERATRLFVRLQWKAESLAFSYDRAMDILRQEEGREGHAEHQHHGPFGSRSKQAEAMFKVDFFEFYTLLERYITNSLSILGIFISGNPGTQRTYVNGLRFITNPEWAKTRPEASHAFHANLLDAIDKETCPLHASFGNAEVRPHLGRAKDYRNAWKDAQEKVKLGGGVAVGGKDDEIQHLPLMEMLRLLIAGCDHAHGIVQNFNVNANGVTSRDFETQQQSYAHESMEADIPFEYMDDEMDLD